MTITIDEAIKLQYELPRLLREVGFNKYIASVQLGIEALEQLGDWRRGGIVGLDEPLPSETK